MKLYHHATVDRTGNGVMLPRAWITRLTLKGMYGGEYSWAEIWRIILPSIVWERDWCDRGRYCWLNRAIDINMRTGKVETFYIKLEGR